ncbi:UDP-glucose 4-epimerase GalE [Chloroflexota bacterium]
MNILVTGGAGYIGSVLTEELVEQGHQVVVLDNLTQGHRAAVVPEVIFVKRDLDNWVALENIFQHTPIEVVMHLAAYTSVEQSMAEPGRYFWNNVASSINLLECMVRYNVDRLVFSSSAAIYGQPEQIPVTESAPPNPVNPYGESKIMFERILHWYSQAHKLNSISLRYFNVAGASKRFGSDHTPETLLIPNVIKVALGQAEYIPVFGTDYDTRDGTCIRDYIHVIDIAKAHILALGALEESASCQAYNLGSSKGFSVNEVIATARRVTRSEIPVRVHPRRPGDPPELVASSALAKKEIGWEPKHSSLEEIIGSAWEWQKEHPNGYTRG